MSGFIIYLFFCNRNRAPDYASDARSCAAQYSFEIS